MQLSFARSVSLTINTFILIVLLTSYNSNCLAQTTGRGKQIEQPIKQAFKVNDTQLNKVVQQLTDVLKGKQPLQNIDKFFFSDAEWKNYVSQLKKQKYPINEQAIPIFKSFSDELKTDLKGYYNIVQGSQLMQTQTRYGTTNAMKVVSIILNLTLKNGDIVSERIQLLQYENTYKLFSTNN